MSNVRTRTRITKEGTEFLTEYVRTGNAYPHRAEKEAILARLRAIPGNESFNLQKLNSWFTRHRNPIRSEHVPILLDDETILFPKLTPTHIQQLRVLYKRRADPSEAIITFWAGRIQADREEVAAWIQYQQEKAREDDIRATPESPESPLRQLVSDDPGPSVSPIVSELGRPHLPTPAKSPTMSPQTRLLSLPPIAIKVEERRSSLSTMSHVSSPLDHLPPLSRLPSRSSLVYIPSTDSNTTLATTLRDSLELPKASVEQPPRTAGEFAEKFENVENMITAFMQRYDAGQLARLGWDASLGNAAS